jgi:CubicO group peptidase (beta-lactamase class C family)
MDAQELRSEVELVPEASDFSGSVCLDVDGSTVVSLVRGEADRRCAMPITSTTRIGIASGAKGFTARRRPALDRRRRRVEHLLAHRSGIGDYFDEDDLDDIDDYVMSLPVHRYLTTDVFLPSLDGTGRSRRPASAPPTTTAATWCWPCWSNARPARRCTTSSTNWCVAPPASHTHTAFLRSDELPSDAATGYLGDGLRTNVLHLPIRGSGDGGIFTTADDVPALCEALAEGRVVGRRTFAAMTTPRSTTADGRQRYGLGFWLHGTNDAVMLEGHDAGASFRSIHQRSRGITASVLSNTSGGAWPVARRLAELLEL